MHVPIPIPPTSLVVPLSRERLLIIAIKDLDGQPAVATDLEALLNAVQGLDLLFGQAPAVEVKVGLDARLSHALGQHAEALVQAPLEQDLLGRLALCLGDGQERLVLGQGRVGAAEG